MSTHGKLLRIQGLTVDSQPIVGDYHDQELREELTACQQFLVDSQSIKSRQRFFNFASTNNTPSFLKDKVQHALGKLHCAAKVNWLLDLFFTL